MSAKYSRVPSVDPELGHDISLDFSSDFTYSNPVPSNKKYKSIFSYSDSRHQMDQSISVVKQSLCSRVCELVVTVVSFILCILTFPISAWKSFKVVSESERLVVFRLGKLQGAKGPGIVFIVPCIDTWKKVDVRIKAFNVPPLQIITLDRGIIEMGADVYYNISDVVKSVTTVQDLNSSIRALLRNVLMNHVVKYEMDQVEAQKHIIVSDVMATCNKTCAGWGVSISKMEFSPIKILQVPKPGANVPGFGSEGVSQVFQQIAQSFMPGGAGQSFTPQPLTVSERRPDPSGAAAVGHEDISLVPAPNPRDILALVQAVMSETLVRAVGAVYEFSLSGANGGIYYLDLKHGSGSIGEGHDPRKDPDVNLDLSVQDMQQMFMGHLKPLQAYMSGRLKVSGDLSAAMRLEEVLERIKSLTNSAGNRDEDEMQNGHVYEKPVNHSAQPYAEYEALAGPASENSPSQYYESVYVPLATEPQQNATEDAQLSVNENFRAVVAAIDFGTTYSGWSYALRDDFLTDPTKVTVKNWSSGSITSCKAPTCILISPDGVSVEAFGYEAETKYAELVQAGRHKDYYFFSRFKMELHKSIQQGVKRNFELASANGRSLKANDVFALSIKWLKEDLVSEWTNRLPGTINEADVHWMLTVPAIWSDAAKQFMHEAAVKAGIDAEKLSIVLEPEVASVVCRYTTTLEASDVHFKNGLKYLILDAGGGTIDVTVHEIVGKNYLKEVALASGGRWGGITVDNAFEELIKDMVGAEVYDEFTEHNRDDYIEVMRHFEIKKRLTSEETEKDVVFSLPLSLLGIYQCQTGLELDRNDTKDGITIKRNKLHVKKTVFKKLFTETCGHIVEHLRKIIGRDKVGDISVIMMVGGFSECLILQDAVKQYFPGIKVIVPRDASLCVLKGAVMYGHFSNVITERVIRYTYGTNVYKPFEKSVHPLSKLIETERGDFCKDIFSKYVQAGQVVKVGEPQTQKLYHPVKTSQKKMFLAIYASELPDPDFVTDPGCTRIGTITVDMPDTTEDLKREVLVTFSFSGTELIVTAKDTTSGTVSNVIMDLLS